MMPCDAERDPHFKNFLEFFPARFQGLGIRPHALELRDVAEEGFIILDDLVFGPAHRGLDIFREHRPYFTATLRRELRALGMLRGRCGPGIGRGRRFSRRVKRRCGRFP